jgi:predicted nucleic acid-binding protein
LPDGLVFDSWAIIALFQNEAPAERVKHLLAESARLNNAWIASVNLGEAWYMLVRKHSVELANHAIDELDRIGLERVDIDWPMVMQAANFKSRHKISYADAFAAALAKQRNAELVTGDGEFRALQSEIKIHWL